MSKDIRSKQFTAGNCYSYILSSQGEALVIDPHVSLNKEYAMYLKKNRLRLKYIIDTHTHADHFSLAAVLKKNYGAPVLMHEKAISSVADKRLKDGDEITLGSKALRVIYTPGHTDDAISIYTGTMIFTADVLLIGSVGRTDFQNGSPEAMFDTLQRLKALSDDTFIFPGHDYHQKRFSTVAKEKAANPFLKETNKEIFVRNMRSKQMPKPFNIDNIIRLNQRGEAVALEMVSASDVYKIISKGEEVKLLDVRSPLEFSEAHIKDAVNIPLNMLGAKLQELSASGGSYIVLCRTGSRSPMAADMMMQSGIHQVRVMDGGMVAWQKEGFPVIKGEGGVSLERQVRVIAGSLVLFGTLMAFVDWRFIFISIFISCGLIYAGLSDNCLMAMLLMKLPYNKKLYSAKLGGGTCSISD